jgi:hypothetical protein
VRNETKRIKREQGFTAALGVTGSYLTANFCQRGWHWLR